MFSKASGLHLNVNKCELMAVKDSATRSIANIPVKDTVIYLGISITKDQKARNALNFIPILEKTQKRFNLWLLRDLSLRGRTLITIAEGISRLTYAALSLHINSKTIQCIDQMLFNFLWKNKTHYIKKSVVINTYENGGLNFLDFASLNNTFKINWIKQFLKKPNSIWNCISNYIFSKIGGLKFLLVCNYNIEKIPIRLSSFHKQVLLAWSMIYKHNFSPHRYSIWNNKDILYKNRSIFFGEWFNSNIIWVRQLFNSNGVLFSYEEFLQYYGIPITPKQYAIVFDAIPSGVLMLFKSSMSVNILDAPFTVVTDSPVGKICFSPSGSKNNCKIRALFQYNIVSVCPVISYWNSRVNNLCWEKIWSLPQKFFVVNKVKEVSFKIIHRCYPVKSFFIKFKYDDLDLKCAFCDSHTETVIHLFWKCEYTRKLWQDVCRFILDHICCDFELLLQNVLFGFVKNDAPADKEYFLINLILILAKFYIHKCKFAKVKPLFYVFMKELKLYFKSISSANNKKAIKTINLCSHFNIFNSI